MSKFACLQGQICEENKKRVSVACYGIACFARTTRVTVGQYAFYCHKIYLRFVSLESKIAVEKARQIQPLDYEKVKAFLTYFARKQYQNDEEKNEFFNSFIYRVVLFDDSVYIFYNTSPNTPTKVKLEKSDLNELREYREKRKSTQFVPLGFKLGALGGERGIRTPG